MNDDGLAGRWKHRPAALLPGKAGQAFRPLRPRNRTAPAGVLKVPHTAQYVSQTGHNVLIGAVAVKTGDRDARPHEESIQAVVCAGSVREESAPGAQVEGDLAGESGAGARDEQALFE